MPTPWDKILLERPINAVTIPAMVEKTKNMRIPERVRAARRIVIKVGSALLLDDAGAVNTSWLMALAEDITALKSGDADVAIVSSGAIGLGRQLLGLERRLKLEEKQAAAAAGQSLLMEAWQSALAPHALTAAQILLTLNDTEHRRRYLNARETIETLIGLGAIPIVNENDTIATDEIRYGDNDRLAAHVAQMCGADLLVMLSDIDGLYDRDPRIDDTAKHIPVVIDINADVEAMAGGPNAQRGAGSGGMATKIAAAKIAAASGCAAIVAKGNIDHPLSALQKDLRCTLFPPKQAQEKARRNWIAGRLKPRGAIQIDNGAAIALRNGASLLSAGVVQVEGAFEKGDAVAINGPDGALVAQGLCAYDSRELATIVGLKSEEIEDVLGYVRAAVVHRNDMALA